MEVKKSKKKQSCVLCSEGCTLLASLRAVLTSCNFKFWLFSCSSNSDVSFATLHRGYHVCTCADATCH